MGRLSPYSCRMPNSEAPGEQIHPVQYRGLPPNTGALLTQASAPRHSDDGRTVLKGEAFSHLHVDDRGREYLVLGTLKSPLTATGDRGPFVFASIEVRPTNTDGYIDVAALRVPLGQIRTTIAQLMNEQDQAVRDLYKAMHRGREAAWLPPTPGQRRRGKEAERDDYLRRLAEAYLAEQNNGVGLHRRLADRFRDPKGRPTPEQTIKAHVLLTTREGWLRAGVQGQRGREAGPTLVAWRHQNQANKS